MHKHFPKYALSIIWLVLILVLCWLPKSTFTEPSWFSFPNQDKVVHFTLFFVWVYFLKIDLLPKNALYSSVLILGLSLALACITEYFQPILSNRTCDWQDGLADMIGAVFSLIFFQKKK